ncbi:helix-turn-helix domain-containing protein [Chryseobacterium sp. HR92]|uniref:helix-turn-helix domain-containing protein n=1 Tax=Chryseobacterium sp. HR92 TaxID=3094839 RepID=UPI00388D0BE3|nr:helix-turn-helix domain-containing protein [Chryseobacterium sp. HR92]
MDREVQQITGPNYLKIYSDILEQKFPDKMNECKMFMEKETLSALEIISLNQIIFGSETISTRGFSSKHRSYDEKSIFEILVYQQENKLSNSEVSKFYKISRNTLAKWRKQYCQITAESK